MQSGAGTFAHGIKPPDAGAGVEIHLDAAAHVVGARHDGNVLLGHVDADGETFGINVREMVFGFFRVLVRHV